MQPALDRAMYCTFLRDEGDRWRPALDWMKNGISLKDGGARLRPALDWMMHCTHRRPLAASPRLETKGVRLRPALDQMMHCAFMKDEADTCGQPSLNDALNPSTGGGARLRPALDQVMHCTYRHLQSGRPLAASPRPNDARHLSEERRRPLAASPRRTNVVRADNAAHT